MQKAAFFASAVFHPLLMPLVSLYLATQYDWYLRGMIQPEQMNLIFIVVVLSTVIFPGVNMLLLRWSGMVSSLQMPEKKERRAPFLSTAFFFILGYYLLRKGQLLDSFYAIYLGCILALLLVTIINYKWKISVHSAGVAGLVGCMVALFQIHQFGNIFLLSLLIVASGITMSSRLILNAHTPAEVYTGAVTGFCAVYFCVLWGVVI